MSKEELPVDKGWAWMICVAVFIITFLLSATGQTLSVTLLDLVVKFDTSITTVSLMFMLQISAASICSIVSANILVPKFGLRRVCVVSAFISTISSIIFSFSPNIYICIFLCGIRGGCHGCLAIPAMSVIGYYFKKYRSIATTLSMCGICGGSIAYPPLVRYLLSVYGLEGTYLLSAAIEGHMIVACMLIRPLSCYRIPPPAFVQSKQAPDETNKQEDGVSKKPINEENGYEKVKEPSDAEDSVDIEKSLIDQNEETNDHFHYEKANGTPKGRHHPVYHKARSVSFTTQDDDTQTNDATDTLIMTEKTQEEADANHHDSPKSKLQKMYSNSKSLSNTSSTSVDENVVRKRQLLKDSQRPSVWSLVSAPSTIGIPQDTTDVTHEQRGTQTTPFTCWQKINQIFDFSLFKQWTFVWTLIAAFPCGPNQLVFVYLPTIAVLRGATKDQGALLVTILGSVDLGSRLIVGLIADAKIFKISTILGSASIGLGIVCLFVELYTDMTTFIVMAVCMGLFVGIRMSLGTVLFIEIVGLQKMAKAFSVYAMFLTMSGALHNPLLGKMMESLGVESVMYYFSFVFILAGIMFGMIPLIMRLESKFKRKKTELLDP